MNFLFQFGVLAALSISVTIGAPKDNFYNFPLPGTIEPTPAIDESSTKPNLSEQNNIPYEDKDAAKSGKLQQSPAGQSAPLQMPFSGLFSKIAPGNHDLFPVPSPQHRSFGDRISRFFNRRPPMPPMPQFVPEPARRLIERWVIIRPYPFLVVFDPSKQQDGPGKFPDAPEEPEEEGQYHVPKVPEEPYHVPKVQEQPGLSGSVEADKPEASLTPVSKTIESDQTASESKPAGSTTFDLPSVEPSVPEVKIPEDHNDDDNKIDDDNNGQDNKEEKEEEEAQTGNGYDDKNGDDQKDEEKTEENNNPASNSYDDKKGDDDNDDDDDNDGGNDNDDDDDEE